MNDDPVTIVTDGFDGRLHIGSAYSTVSADTAASPAAELNYYYAALELTVALLACVGNAAVITVFYRERRLRKRTNYYIVSLAMADFLVGLLGIPFAVLASVGLPRNLYGCLLTLSTLVVLCTISIFCLVAVSVDRYWAILYPLAYSRNVRTKTAIGIISLCWVCGIFVGFLPLLGWRASSAGPTQACLFVQVMNYDYLVFLYFATIILPAMLLLLFYAHIYTVIMKQVRKTVTIGGAGGTGDKPHKPTLMSMTRSQGGTMLRVLGAARKREVKATQNLSVIVLFFMICWLPLYTINCIKAFCHDCEIPAWLTLFLIILSHLNSAMNPLLYAYHLKDFRAALKSLICRVFGVKVEQEEINYRFSVHSQNRLASRMEKMRGAAGQQPKIYIDSPVYHRQQTSSSTATSPITSAVINHNSNHRRNHRSDNMTMWRILEVSADDKSIGTQPTLLSSGVSPFDNHEYIFNYDVLDAGIGSPAKSAEAAAAEIVQPVNTDDKSPLFDVRTAMGRLQQGRDDDEHRSLPVFYNDVELESGSEGGAMLPDSRTKVRRRSATTGDLAEHAMRVAAPADRFGGNHVLRLETQILLEHERQAAAEAMQLKQQVWPRRRCRRRRCRSASNASERNSVEHRRQLSRSWSALYSDSATSFIC